MTIDTPRGRSLYSHLVKSYFGQSKFLFTMEKQRLNRLGAYHFYHGKIDG